LFEESPGLGGPTAVATADVARRVVMVAQRPFQEHPRFNRLALIEETAG